MFSLSLPPNKNGHLRWYLNGLKEKEWFFSRPLGLRCHPAVPNLVTLLKGKKRAPASTHSHQMKRHAQVLASLKLAVSRASAMAHPPFVKITTPALTTRAMNCKDVFFHLLPAKRVTTRAWRPGAIRRLVAEPVRCQMATSVSSMPATWAPVWEAHVTPVHFPMGPPALFQGLLAPLMRSAKQENASVPAHQRASPVTCSGPCLEC